MLGTVSVSYTDLDEGESQIESFSDVEGVSIAGNIDGLGNTLIISHGEEKENTVRSGIVFRGIE